MAASVEFDGVGTVTVPVRVGLAALTTLPEPVVALHKVSPLELLSNTVSDQGAAVGKVTV